MQTFLKNIKSYNPVIILLILLLIACGQKRTSSQKPDRESPRNEVIYHVVQRSFYDSNGDLHGDLPGLQQKLDYLQELGVTSLLLLPLYESVYYHNYFSSDFEKIDPEFGTMQDYHDLLEEIHKRGMKFYMDMETQYITEGHQWYRDSYRNPASAYTDYLIYNGPGNTEPEPIVWNITDLPGYNGVTRKVTTVNLLSKQVLAYNFNLFKHWVDPNNDGNFDDGVDGFRLDHMMDDLDRKGKLTGLFDKFWLPLITTLKEINPDLKFIAEQADWTSFGIDYIKNGGVDRVFAFRLQQAIASFDKQKIMAMADSTFSLTPDGNQQVVFIENHDMPRFSTVVDQILARLKTGAALNLLLGGIPSIYYGQELGMTGSGGLGKFGNTDGNDIPMREAFEWYKEVDGKGMALWYKNTGPWWEQSNLKSNDGISLEEQRKDPASLWNFYRDLLALRKEYAALAEGKYHALGNNNSEVLSFLRYTGDKHMVVAINLSGTLQEATVALSGNAIPGNIQTLRPVYGIDGKVKEDPATLSVVLPAYGLGIWAVD